MDRLEGLKQKYSGEYFNYSVNAIDDTFFVELYDDWAGDYRSLPISFPSELDLVACLCYHELPRLLEEINEEEENEKNKQINSVAGKLDAMLKGKIEFDVVKAVGMVNELFSQLNDITFFTLHGGLKELVMNSDLIEEVLRVSFVADWAAMETSAKLGWKSLHASQEMLVQQLKVVLVNSNFDSEDVRKIFAEWLWGQWEF